MPTTVDFSDESEQEGRKQIIERVGTYPKFIEQICYTS